MLLGNRPDELLQEGYLQATHHPLHRDARFPVKGRQRVGHGPRHPRAAQLEIAGLNDQNSVDAPRSRNASPPGGAPARSIQARWGAPSKPPPQLPEPAASPPRPAMISTTSITAHGNSRRLPRRRRSIPLYSGRGS